MTCPVLVQRLLLDLRLVLRQERLDQRRDGSPGVARDLPAARLLHELRAKLLGVVRAWPGDVVELRDRVPRLVRPLPVCLQRAVDALRVLRPTSCALRGRISTPSRTRPSRGSRPADSRLQGQTGAATGAAALRLLESSARIPRRTSRCAVAGAGTLPGGCSIRSRLLHFRSLLDSYPSKEGAEGEQFFRGRRSRPALDVLVKLGAPEADPVALRLMPREPTRETRSWIRCFVTSRYAAAAAAESHGSSSCSRSTAAVTLSSIRASSPAMSSTLIATLSVKRSAAGLFAGLF